MRTMAECKNIRVTDDGQEVPREVYDFVCDWLQKGTVTTKEIEEVRNEKNALRQLLVSWSKICEMRFKNQGVKPATFLKEYLEYEEQVCLNALKKTPSCINKCDLIYLLFKFISEQPEDPTTMRTPTGYKYGFNVIELRSSLFKDKPMVERFFTYLVEDTNTF